MSPATDAVRFDEDLCYDALVSRDPRFDGQFVAGITSTGIYCRASCPAPVRPKRQNVRVFATAAAAQAAGFRSCKRCRPDASPGSPEWDRRGDIVGRAMRLIEAGEVDRTGVSGLARRLAVSERHLHRVLTEELGAAPVSLARAQRANLARILLETTELSITDVGYAAGFSSIRQFNDTMRAIYDRTPTEIRRTKRRVPAGKSEHGPHALRLSLRLPLREPFDTTSSFGLLARHAIPGVAVGTDSEHRRSVRLAGGPAHVHLRYEDGAVSATFTLSAMSDLAAAIAASRDLLDLDTDPELVRAHLSSDTLIGPLIDAAPGVRIPGSVDGFESVVATIISQQVSVAGARTLTGRLVAMLGEPLESDHTEYLFPAADALAQADLSGIGLTGRRASTIRHLAKAVSEGELVLNGSADRAETRRRLLALPGIGPWTVDVTTMRVCRDPDVLVASDLAVRRKLEAIGAPPDGRAAWAPWRSYVTSAIWTSAAKERQ